MCVHVCISAIRYASRERGGHEQIEPQPTSVVAVETQQTGKAQRRQGRQAPGWLARDKHPASGRMTVNLLPCVQEHTPRILTSPFTVHHLDGPWPSRPPLPPRRPRIHPQSLKRTAPPSSRLHLTHSPTQHSCAAAQSHSLALHLHPLRPASLRSALRQSLLRTSTRRSARPTRVPSHYARA